MLQRLGLAQALINDPQILFLDEPTDGVDPIGRKEIRDILLNQKAHGTTIFLNSHLLSEVEMISDRVAILNKGQIVRVGSVTDLTMHKLTYTIHVSVPIPPEMLTQLQITFPSIQSKGMELNVTLRDKVELNIIIDALRAEGIGIESMAQQKTSLEDYFIQLVKEENA
jgi:ABC-2 type transport system ATP-binding protein